MKEKERKRKEMGGNELDLKEEIEKLQNILREGETEKLQDMLEEESKEETKENPKRKEKEGEGEKKKGTYPEGSVEKTLLLERLKSVGRMRLTEEGKAVVRTLKKGVPVIAFNPGKGGDVIINDLLEGEIVVIRKGEIVYLPSLLPDTLTEEEKRRRISGSIGLKRGESMGVLELYEDISEVSIEDLVKKVRKTPSLLELLPQSGVIDAKTFFESQGQTSDSSYFIDRLRKLADVYDIDLSPPPSLTVNKKKFLESIYK